MKEKGIEVEYDGAICVFTEELKNKQGEQLTFIIKKSDGEYLYGTLCCEHLPVLQRAGQIR